LAARCAAAGDRRVRKKNEPSGPAACEATRLSPWEEEEHVKRLLDLCHGPVPFDVPIPRRGAARQLLLRQREHDLRGNLVQLVEDLHDQGRGYGRIADDLRLSTRTLRFWRADFLEPPDATSAPKVLGRPTVRSPLSERRAVLAVVDELGPG